MKDTAFALDRLRRLTGIETVCYEGESFFDLYPRLFFNPLLHSKELLERILSRARGQEVPVLLEEEHHVWFGCIRRKRDGREENGREEKGMEDCGKTEAETFYLFGPVCLYPLPLSDLHRFCRDYGEKAGAQEALPVVSFVQLLSFAQTAALLLSGVAVGDEEILAANGLSRLGEGAGQTPETDFSVTEEVENEFHHTYEEERKLLSCVREGRVEEALSFCMLLDETMGKMSRSEYRQMQKTVVVAVTLCTRAAIEGGLSPAEAYRLSDYYIQKSEECRDIPSLVDCRNQAVGDLTRRVKKEQSRRETSTYVAAACDYVIKHYREKIRLEEVAGVLGISPSYLSRLFSRQMEMPLQDYVVQVRVERAANLLAYSMEEIAAIGDYVGFPSQSYFGRVFKKIKGLTPREYRNRFKPREFAGKG